MAEQKPGMESTIAMPTLSRRADRETPPLSFFKAQELITNLTIIIKREDRLLKNKKIVDSLRDLMDLMGTLKKYNSRTTPFDAKIKKETLGRIVSKYNNLVATLKNDFQITGLDEIGLTKESI